MWNVNICSRISFLNWQTNLKKIQTVKNLSSYCMLAIVIICQEFVVAQTILWRYARIFINPMFLNAFTLCEDMYTMAWLQKEPHNHVHIYIHIIDLWISSREYTLLVFDFNKILYYFYRAQSEKEHPPSRRTCKQAIHPASSQAGLVVSFEWEWNGMFLTDNDCAYMQISWLHSLTFQPLLCNPFSSRSFLFRHPSVSSSPNHVLILRSISFSLHWLIFITLLLFFFL